MADVETVSPHAVVGYCILRWLTSTQDVPTELLGVFFVVKWIDCFRALCLCDVCVRAWARPLRCKQDLLLPSNHGRQSAAVCSTAAQPLSFFFPLSTGYWVWWVVMATGERLFSVILLLSHLTREREEAGRESNPPTSRTDQENLTGTSWNRGGNCRVWFLSLKQTSSSQV